MLMEFVVDIGMFEVGTLLVMETDQLGTWMDHLRGKASDVIWCQV